MKSRSYTELLFQPSLTDRYNYLALRGTVGVPTFGFERYLNQRFYQSNQWRTIRRHVILRDKACDLGIEDFPIPDGQRIYIHHMNPMTVEEIESGSPVILDPEFLITTILPTHNAIHYGDVSQLPQPFVERQPGDTKLW